MAWGKSKIKLIRVWLKDKYVEVGFNEWAIEEVYPAVDKTCVKKDTACLVITARGNMFESDQDFDTIVEKLNS